MNYYSLIFFTGILTVVAIAWVYFLGEWFHLPLWGFLILMAAVVGISMLISRGD